MEGRAIARPNRVVLDVMHASQSTPSMEGRAIARPNALRADRRPLGSTAFNGGPGNCPAKHVRGALLPAGGRVPSMEGRAIARPNREASAKAGATR